MPPIQWPAIPQPQAPAQDDVEVQQIVAVDWDGNEGPQLVAVNPVAAHANMWAQVDLDMVKQEMRNSTFYDELAARAIPKTKPSLPALFKNQKEQIRLLEETLFSYNGYITQRQLVDALNRVLASKKMKRWRPEHYDTKTDFLNAFVNHLWAVIPDTTTDQKDVDHT